ncbi:protein obstructor-E-like [Microplitis mediator]|uniref:protein obstructor-E-like n=1 Tax=Microplitis mediator TaxID=375433 RepID=UPI002555036E|nr:protein obstructor-E-like [Microplitis mediator]
MKTKNYCLLMVYIGVTTALSRKQQHIELGLRRTAPPGLKEDVVISPYENDQVNDDEILEVPAQCLEVDGYYPDSKQCDKYYDCKDGKYTEKLCPDGLVFNDFSPQHEKCDLPFGVDCSKRPNRQTPQSSQHCPRMHGYFAHENARICDTFYYCVEGKFNMITCPDGLVFSEKSGICNWPDEAQKHGCGSRELFNFTCPQVDTAIAATHPRYPDLEDCQFFYVCINGETPRRSGCKLGQAFDERTKKCDWARNVPECKDWYKDQLTDEELYALEHPVSRLKVNNSQSKRRGSKP